MAVSPVPWTPAVHFVGPVWGGRHGDRSGRSTRTSHRQPSAPSCAPAQGAGRGALTLMAPCALLGRRDGPGLGSDSSPRVTWKTAPAASCTRWIRGVSKNGYVLTRPQPYAWVGKTLHCGRRGSRHGWFPLRFWMHRFLQGCGDMPPQCVFAPCPTTAWRPDCGGNLAAACGGFRPVRETGERAMGTPAGERIFRNLFFHRSRPECGQRRPISVLQVRFAGIFHQTLCPYFGRSRRKV